MHDYRPHHDPRAFRLVQTGTVHARRARSLANGAYLYGRWEWHNRPHTVLSAMTAAIDMQHLPSDWRRSHYDPQPWALRELHAGPGSEGERRTALRIKLAI